LRDQAGAGELRFKLALLAVDGDGNHDTS
jgi:hypothetical protein